MQAELRKLAGALREQAKAQKEQQRMKCAQVLQAITALELLRRKIGG